MRGMGKFLIGVGIFIELFVIFAFMGMGQFIGFVFFVMTGFAVAFVAMGAFCINRANEADNIERRFRELEDENKHYKNTHSRPVSTVNLSEPKQNQPQEQDEEDDWFKD